MMLGATGDPRRHVLPQLALPPGRARRLARSRPGSAFLPFALVIGVGAHLASRAARRASARACVVVAGLALVRGRRAPARRRPGDAGYVTDLLPGCLALGFGAGLVFPSASVTAMHDVGHDDAGLASGLHVDQRTSSAPRSASPCSPRSPRRPARRPRRLRGRLPRRRRRSRSRSPRWRWSRAPSVKPARRRPGDGALTATVARTVATEPAIDHRRADRRAQRRGDPRRRRALLGDGAATSIAAVAGRGRRLARDGLRPLRLARGDPAGGRRARRAARDRGVRRGAAAGAPTAHRGARARAGRSWRTLGRHTSIAQAAAAQLSPTRCATTHELSATAHVRALVERGREDGELPHRPVPRNGW